MARFEKQVLYTHWASALVNDDLTEYEPEELAEIEEWQAQNPDLHCVDVDQDHWFGFPDYGTLRGDVTEFTFQIT